VLDIFKAFAVAKKLHSGQFRKGCDVPYWTHLRDVAALVKKHGGSRDQIVAALFHDAIEDQNVTRSWVSETAGEEVGRMVSECSKADGIENWDVRFKEYSDRLLICSEDTRLVVLADKVSNLTDISKDYDVLGDELWSRFSKGSETINQYIRYAEIFDSWGILEVGNGLRDAYKLTLKKLLEVI